MAKEVLSKDWIEAITSLVKLQRLLIALRVIRGEDIMPYDQVHAYFGRVRKDLQ